MKAAILLQIFNVFLCIVCVVGVVYSPFDKVASMWVAGGIYIVVGFVGTVLIDQRFDKS